MKEAPIPLPRKHDLSADLARALAILMVVTVHVSAPLWQDRALFGSPTWWSANLFLAVARMGVPIFFMLSGMFLLDPAKPESLDVFFRKRCSKVLIPFLSWALFYLFVKHVWSGQPLGFRHIVGEILQGPVYTHFWFFYVLFGIYLATPLLRPMLGGMDGATKAYFLVLWFVVESLLPLIERFVGIGVGVTFVVATGYVGYFVAGQVLRDFPAGRHRRALAVLVFVSVGCTALGSFLMNRAHAGLDETFSGNRAPNVVVGAVATFLLIRSWKPGWLSTSSRPGQAALLVGRQSFGIYLVHFIVLRLLRNEWHWLSPAVLPVLSIPFAVLVVTALSLAITVLLGRTPVLKATVGS